MPIKVLLVEDDPEAATLTSSQVSQGAGDIFQVEWRNNILNAISRLAKPGVDVVLLDLGMQELSGFKTHRAIKSALPRAVPIVILTADDSRDSQDIARFQGAANYLIKHCTSSVELREALYAAVVPAIPPKAASGRSSRVAEAVRHLVANFLVKGRRFDAGPLIRRMTPEQARRIQHEILPGSGSIPNGDPFLTYGMWVLPFSHDAKGISVFLPDRPIVSKSEYQRAMEETARRLRVAVARKDTV